MIKKKIGQLYESFEKDGYLEYSVGRELEENKTFGSLSTGVVHSSFHIFDVLF